MSRQQRALQTWSAWVRSAVDLRLTAGDAATCSISFFHYCFTSWSTLCVHHEYLPIAVALDVRDHHVHGVRVDLVSCASVNAMNQVTTMRTWKVMPA